MKLIRKLAYGFERIVGFAAFLAGLILVFDFLSITAGVIMRYFFKHPLLWVDEITSTSLLFIAFLGAAWVMKKRGHVVIDIIISRVKPGTKIVLEIISYVVGAFCCAVITYFGALSTWRNLVSGAYQPTTLEIPNWYVLIIIPVGSLLFFIQCIINASQAITKSRTKPLNKTAGIKESSEIIGET